MIKRFMLCKDMLGSARGQPDRPVRGDWEERHGVLGPKDKGDEAGSRKSQRSFLGRGQQLSHLSTPTRHLFLSDLDVSSNLLRHAA